MITYHVRSRALVDLYNEIKQGKLVLAPHFQRKLVWRLTHKVDFIKTILLGYPFPEIFLSRGRIDLDSMTSCASVVDGQQRLTAIREFVDNAFEVEGRVFADLEASEKEQFLKYEIAVIDLDLEATNPTIVEIFQRLNRTFYALSNIEKMSTEYASTEFMLLAKLLAGEFRGDDSDANISAEKAERDPNLESAWVKWANEQKVTSFQKFVVGTDIFSKYEVSRQVHLMFVLNVLATRLRGYYNRNDGAKECLEAYQDSRDEMESLLQDLEAVAAFVHKVRPVPSAFWYSKSNAFTLFIELCNRKDRLDKAASGELREALSRFAEEAPPDYRLAAKEGVNNLKERQLRGDKVGLVLDTILGALEAAS